MSSLRVLPEFRSMVWGNSKINEIFQIELKEPVGEIWLLSGHPLYENRLEDGRKVNEFGQRLYNGKYQRFPILIKLVSTNQWLSVQVHPDDWFAKEFENEPWGKSEAWYFLSDGEFAICEDAEKMIELAENGKLDKMSEILTFVKVKRGTFVNIPAGTVHALGPNSTVIEVQQSSDLTYRIYDWGRPRETHLEKALKVSKNIGCSEIIYENAEKLVTNYFVMEVKSFSGTFSSDVSLPTISIPLEINKDFSATINFERTFLRNNLYVYDFLK
uniref:Class I mannose-6-phosphate isomerase n=1 Tax=Fervidobacterium nodosum TaxID=2424 RepID=A0A7C5U2F6_9BACT